MKPYTVLGTFKPKKWRASVIGQELTWFTNMKGLTPHASVPMLKVIEKCSWKNYALHASVVRFAHPEYEGSGWHQDGDHAPGADMNCRLVLWSNRDCTEIRSGGVVYTPKPFEVVIFNNLECYHRRPPHVEGKRWLFRQRVRP